MAQEITNDQANGQASQPQLVMQKIYVKDVSFEAPNAPQIFQDIGENDQVQPQVQLNLGQRATDLGNSLYEVVLSLTLTCTIGERTAFRDIFDCGGTLYSMDPAKVSNLDKARENARLFAGEVLRLLPARTRMTGERGLFRTIRQAA